MRLLKYKKIALALVGLALNASLQAVEIISKTTGTPDFTNTITAKTFDRCSGTFFVGLTAGEATFAISKAGPSDTTFTPIATDADVNNAGIGELSLIPKDHTTCVGCDCTGTAATDIAVSFDFGQTNSTRIAVGDVAGASFTLSGILAGAAGNTIRRVSHITTNTFMVFARGVAAGAAPATVDIFGDPLNSSIDTIRVDTAVAGPQLRIIQGVVGGTVGGTAGVRLDPTSQQLRSGPATTVRAMNVRDMTWSDDLQRLYIAMTVIGVPGTNRSTYGLVQGTVNASGQLTLDYITSGTPQDNTINTIFAYGFNVGLTSTIDIRKVRTMKTSTGLNYLIINGGIMKGTAAGALSNGILPGNKIYALPLGSATTSQAGKIVMNRVSTGPSAQSCDASRFFDTPLTDSFQILANAIAPVLADWDMSTTVGNCTAPWRQDIFASDMVVVGDTVYVSMSGLPRDASNDPGVWASQAMFDNTGKIISWTAWQRVFPSLAGGLGVASNGDRVPFFDVDAETGKLWRVDFARHEVTRTVWETTGFATGSLAAVIGTNLSDGTFSMLDLIGATPSCQGPLGFSGSNTFALFGGQEKVLFVHPDGATNTVTLPTAFDTPANSLITSNGLAGAGSILSLGYTHNTRVNYFLAGSQTGLYMYAQPTGAGFNTLAVPFTDLASLPLVPATDQWFRVSGIDAAVKSIVACEGKILFLSQDITTTGGIFDRIQMMTVGGTVAATAATLKTVAISGKAFPANTVLSGFTITTNLSLTADGDGFPCSCYGVVTTNDGVYTTTTDITHLVNVAGEWTKVTGTDGIALNFLRNAAKFYDGSTTTSAILKSEKVWCIYLADGTIVCPGTFQNSRFMQIGNDASGDCAEGANGNLGAGGFVPLPDCNCTAIPSEKFYWTSRCNINGDRLLDRSLTLWSDGARRFFTRFSPNDVVFNSLLSLPYGCDSFCMTVPYADPALSAVPRIYTIENLSSTGQILAGTDTGVVVLG